MTPLFSHALEQRASGTNWSTVHPLLSSHRNRSKIVHQWWAGRFVRPSAIIQSVQSFDQLLAALLVKQAFLLHKPRGARRLVQHVVAKLSIFHRSWVNVSPRIFRFFLTGAASLYRADTLVRPRVVAARGAPSPRLDQFPQMGRRDKNIP